VPVAARICAATLAVRTLLIQDPRGLTGLRSGGARDEDQSFADAAVYRAGGKPGLEFAVSDESLLSVHIPEAPVRLWGFLSGEQAKSAANPKNPTINPIGLARFAATPWDGSGQNILTRQWVS
jgi:hypothetical protein